MEIIDEELLSLIKTQEARYTEEIKTAKDVIKYLGPKGGFKGLSFNYTNSQGKTIKSYVSFKSQAKELEHLFKSYDIEIKVIIKK